MARLHPSTELRLTVASLAGAAAAKSLDLAAGSVETFGRGYWDTSG
jgi:hypothetical protein